MLTKRHGAVIAVTIVFLAAGLVFGSHLIRAKGTPDTASIINSNPLLTHAAYREQISSGTLPGLEGGALVFEDDRYRYYTDQEGQLIRVDDIRGKEAVFPDTPLPGYTVKDAEKDAAALVCQAWLLPEAERSPTSLRKHSSVDDWVAESKEFNGSFYLVTLTMVKGGVTTGNKAVVDIAADGSLISALFIRETWSEKGQMLSEEEAIARATEYLYPAISHSMPSIAQDLISAEPVSASIHRLKGSVYWDVLFSAKFHISWMGEEVTPDECTVRLNAETGEFVSLASRFIEEE